MNLLESGENFPGHVIPRDSVETSSYVSLTVHHRFYGPIVCFIVDSVSKILVRHLAPSAGLPYVTSQRDSISWLTAAESTGIAYRMPK